MTKIPVGETITASYRFVFGKFTNLLGLTWFLTAVLSISGFAFNAKITQFSQAAATHQHAAVKQLLPIVCSIELAAFIVIFILTAGIAQEALGMRAAPAPIYFSLGKPVWRLLISYLLAFIIYVLGVILFAIAAFIVCLIPLIAFIIAGVSKGVIVAILTAFTVISLYCFAIYAITRLMFLLTPITIAEEKIALKRAWDLARGNFWRIFLVVLGVSLPIMLITSIFALLMIPHGFFNVPPPGSSPADYAAFRQMQTAALASQQATFHQYWYLFLPLNIMFNTLFLGLTVGAQCFAYRALVPQTNQSGVGAAIWR